MEDRYRKYKMKYAVLKRDTENVTVFTNEDLADVPTVRDRLYRLLDTLDVRSPVFVFDIHNTTEYNDGEIDADIEKFINDHHAQYTILFLSFDGNAERILHNAQILNDHSEIFRRIPKIFIKRRVKGLILRLVWEYLERKGAVTTPGIVFVDDNVHNIRDAEKVLDPSSAILFHYGKHSSHGGKYDDFTKIYELIPARDIGT